MGNFKSTISASGKVGSTTRSFLASRSSSITEVYDKEVTIGNSDTPSLLLDFSSKATEGPNPESAEQIVVQNTDSYGAVELLLEYTHWRGAGEIPIGQYVVSYILAPKQSLVLPNTRGVIYDSIRSAANKESEDGGKITAGTASTYGLTITDGAGKWDTTDLGTSAGSTDTDGMVPGSLVIGFYTPGYQAFGYLKNIKSAQSSSTDTELTADTEYGLSIAVDGGSATDVLFTTDATDTTWGSPTSGNGVLAKIQASIKAADLECDIAIAADGDIRVSSRYGETTSAISLDDPSTGTSIFNNGTIPDDSDLADAVGYAEDTTIENMAWDNGDGTITRPSGGSGTIVSYNEGEIELSLTGMPINSAMKVYYQYESCHSGNERIDTNDCNSLAGVYARSMPINTTAFAEKKASVRILVFE